MKTLIINGHEFVEAMSDRFIIVGDYNQIDYMESKIVNESEKDPKFIARIYRSVYFDGKYYCPKLNTKVHGQI